MKKLRLFMLLALISVLTLLVFVGCKKEERVASVSFKDHDPTTAIEIAAGGFDYNEYTVVVVYESGNTEEIALTEEMISETDLFKLYQIGEHDITVNYGKSQYTFKVSVKRNTFGALTFPENNVFTYDGEAHTVEVDGDIPANAVVTYIGGNSFVNAGTYDVTAVVSCEGYVTQKLSTTVQINRAKYDMSGVKFESKEVVYDGNSHSVAISGKLPEGVYSPTYTINGKPGSSATDVEEYTVIATFANADPNYEAIPEMEATLKITPAEYTVKGVDIVFKDDSGDVISDATKIYDGKSVTVDLNDYSKLSKKLSVSFTICGEDGKVISTSNKKTNIVDVGVYTVKLDFTLADGNNYMPIEPIVRTFEVLKAEYPAIENIEFASAQATYDGKAHSLRIKGKLPTGVTASYEYYKDGKLLVDGEGKPVKSVVDAGRYIVKAIFTHDDTNRGEIASFSAVLNIMAATFNTSNISVEFNGTDIYDGTEKFVTVKGEIPEQIRTSVVYHLNGEELKNADGSYVTSVVDPGEYSVCVYFFSESDNYMINSIVEDSFTVRKAVINVDEILCDGLEEYAYSGEAHSPSIKRETVSESVQITEALFSVDAQGNRTSVDSAVNVGNYVKVFTVTPVDPTRYQLSNSGVIEYEFEIYPMVIDLNAILVEKTFSNTGENLSLKVFEDLEPEIKDLLNYSVQAIEMKDGAGNWVDVGNTNYSERYRVYYNVRVKTEYMNNVTLKYNDSFGAGFSLRYEFNVE